MAASAIAGAATSILSNPIWVVNTRQTVRSTVQADPSLPTTTTDKPIVVKKLGVLQTILHILRTDGIWAFFHGLGPALVLVSNPILQFTLFEQLKNIILARRSIRLSKGAAGAPPLTDLDFFLLGAVSKLFATSITYPCAFSLLSCLRRPGADLSPSPFATLPSLLHHKDLTVKARMQAGGAEGKSYTSAVDGLRKIVKEDGVAGLYRGIGPKLTQSVATVSAASEFQAEGLADELHLSQAALLFLAKEKIYVATKKVSDLFLETRRCRG